MSSTIFHLRNVTVLIGLLVAGVGVVYFATEFMDRISPWGRLVSLVLLAVVFTALGRHYEAHEPREPARRGGWRWLRVPAALYVLGLLAAFVAVIVFLGLEGVDRLVKAGVAVAVGLLLVVYGARRFDPAADEA